MGDFLESFADVAYELEYLWQIFFVLGVVFLVMLGVVFLLVPPGSASYYVALFSTLLAAALTVASGTMVRFCA